jgi:hypothetical protein
MVGMATPSSADVSVNCEGARLDLTFDQKDGSVVLETSDNVNKILESYTQRGFAYGMMKGCDLPLGANKGSTVVELAKGEERYLVVQRLYSGKTTVLKVNSSQVPIVLRGH